MSKKITVSKAIGEALHEEMLRDEKVFIMGEDMAVMGNVFAITKGFLEDISKKWLWDANNASHSRFIMYGSFCDSVQDSIAFSPCTNL